MEPLLVSLLSMLASGLVGEVGSVKDLSREEDGEGEDEETDVEETSEEGSSDIMDYVFPEASAEAETGTTEDEADTADTSWEDEAAVAGAVAVGATLIQADTGDDVDDGDTVAEDDDDTVQFDVVTGLAGVAPALISGFDTATDDPTLKSDQIFLYASDGTLIPESDFTSGERYLSIVDMEDGSGAGLYLDDELVAVIEDYTADELAADTSWVGNFTEGLGELVEVDDDGNDIVNVFADLDEDEAAADDSDDTLVAEPAAEEAVAEDTVTEETVVEDPVAEVTAEDDTDDAIAVEDDTADVTAEAGTTEAAEVTAEETLEVTAEDTAEDDLSAAADADSLAGSEGDDSLTAEDDTAEDDTTLADATATTLEGDSEEEVTISLTVSAATSTGNSVSEEMFGGNVIYTVNTDDGDLNENMEEAIDDLDITSIRYPAGQGDGTAETEGVSWINIVDLDYDEDGNASLSEELTAMLDYARDPNGDGDTSDALSVTLVIPTQNMTLEEYEEFADDLETFSQLVMENYGDVVQAFEVGNEYWSTMGEAEYGAKANIAIKALADGMEAAGYAAEDQPDIIVQMATPTGESDYNAESSDMSWMDRLEAANQTIIDQLDEEARDDLDGVVEHYYYRQDDATYDDSMDEMNYIAQDYAVWDEAFDKDLDLYITEWNIKTTNVDELGLKSASTMVEQFENMIELGVDGADVWAVMHNTSTDLAGDKDGEVTTDDQGRVTTSINGAIYDMMSSSLVGKDLVDLDLTGDDSEVDVTAYADENETVVYISSRSLDVETVEIDLSSLVTDYSSVTGTKIGIDQSTSDGEMWISGQGTVEADYVVIDGVNYYYNEHDVAAEYTDYVFDDTTVTVTLNPYEVIQITIVGNSAVVTVVDTSEDSAALDAASGDDQVEGSEGSDDLSDAIATEATVETEAEATTEAEAQTIVAEEDTLSLDDYIEGTGYGDYLKGYSGDDTILGGNGDDTLAGSQGNDDLSGDKGDDSLNGGQGDDRLNGGSGDDTIIGWTGNDYLKGAAGNDLVDGGKGDDTLAGSQGDDTLYGGDGADEINGGKDDDYISGGAGADTVTGWSGADIFAFATDEIDEGDTITDFQPGKDAIELSLPGVTSVADLVITDREEGGVLVEVPGYGTILLLGDDLTAELVAVEGNFVFLTVAA